MNSSADNAGQGSVPYPLHKVMAIFDDKTKTSHAIEALGAVGVPLDTLETFESGAVVKPIIRIG